MQRLGECKIMEMFGYWVVRQSEHQVAKMCQVSKKTVHKYRLERQWDLRLRNIRKRAREILDAEENTCF